MSGSEAVSDGQALVEIAGVEKRFGALTVLDGVDLVVRRGEVVSIIGPSGGGKTTLLRCINLLETLMLPAS